MSVTVSNWKEICDAPTNNSPAKMAFSFSKSTRFSPNKENRYAPAHSDHKSTTISRRPSPNAPPASATATNTTSPRSTSTTTQHAQKSPARLLPAPHFLRSPEQNC